MGNALDALYDLPAWKITLVLLAAVLCAIEIGHRMGRRSGPKVRGDEVTTEAKSAVIAVLGLLLGFSYSFSAERYDERMAVNWHEANAIERAYFDAGLLEAPTASRLRGILLSYLDVRLSYVRLPPGDPEVRRLDGETSQLHREMWATVMPSVQRDRHDIMTGEVVQALTETMDVATEQRAARGNHVPDAVTLLLMVSFPYGVHLRSS
jgi:hypothetical protein